MGLDMYAQSTSLRVEETVDFRLPDEAEIEDLCYWRKHPNLHGWMEALYREKGGSQEFNCVNLQLTGRDLDRLEQDIIEGNLPQTTGFFFGESNGSDAEKQDDLAFIAKVRKAIADGRTVFYTSWW